MRKLPTSTRTVLALIAALVIALLAAGCGGGSSSSSSSSSESSSSESSSSEESSTGSESSGSVEVDLGNGKSVSLSSNPKPKIGLFAGSGTTWVKVLVEETTKRAEEAGFEVEFIDSKFEPKLQLEQLQNALQNKTYGIWILEPADGNIMCKIASEEAPDQGVAVIVMANPLCGQEFAKGEKTWTPGTVSMVGQADQSDTYKEAWLEAMTERPWWNEAKEIGVLTGIPLYGSTVSSEKALEGVPEVNERVVDELNTDFSPQDAQAKTQAMLRAHPNLNALVSIYSDQTLGAVQALKEAGKLGQVKVVDLGASTQIVEAVRAGEVDFTVPYTPVGTAIAAILSLEEAYEGKTPQRWTDNLELAEEGSMEEPLVIDKEVAKTFEPEY